MSQLDDLLARTRSPGKFVERRHFTLSRRKAIEKQREFALRHPKQYILELIQAAVFAGATYIAIDSRPHSVLVAWVGGQRIGDRDLENLLDYLFADRGDPRWRHLVQLAVGVNAILQRKPRTLRIETGDGATSVRMDLDHRGEGDVGTVVDPIGGTYLYAEFGAGWFARFTSSSYTEEQGLVEERCLYVPVPILLNGGAPFGYRGSRHIEIFGAREQRHFDEQGRRGVVALHASPRAPTGFRMVVGGVWVTTLPLAGLARQPLVGVICDDHLRKTADHSDIVQDHRYVEMLHAVQPHATQLMSNVRGPTYEAPGLPPIPQVIDKPAEGPPVIEAEALPNRLVMVPPRAPITVERLRKALRAAAVETPLFWTPPEMAAELAAGPADPARFPYRVLVLTPGQAATLEHELPGVPVHKLTSRADVDFVRRVLERQSQVREHVIDLRGGRVRVRLHVAGALPDWSEHRAGVPFVVVEVGQTRLIGSLDGTEVRLTGWLGDAPEVAPLPMPLALPRLSLVLERPAGSTAWRAGPDHATVAAVLDQAWKLAVPEGAEPHRPLLCALMGRVAMPQLQSAPELVLAASLPVGHPASLSHVPLLSTPDGVLSLQDFIGLMGTDRVVTVAAASQLEDMAGLEWRFGFGHLTHDSLEGRPVCGVGRIGGRWSWLDRPEMWTMPGLTQVIFVAPSFAPRLADEAWETEDRPTPELVAIRRRGVEGTAWDEGWDLLFQRLTQLELDDAWQTLAAGPVSVPRARGMGRLALLHLVALLGREDQPLLLPSDGGARRSLAELRADPASAVVARHGVEVTEPWTFLLTRDELAAVQGDAPIRLRYDDHPDVWRTLTDGPETGWLIRQETKQGGLAGWLGLRHPYDGTTGILVRSTGRLIALPEMDRRIPCHGLLRPEKGGRTITVEQVRLLQLAGLRMYQDLASLMREGLDPERAETAALYAFVFAQLSRRRGRLSGTALELARLVQMKDVQGRRWGTLENWFDAPADLRPPPPVVVSGDPALRPSLTEDLDPAGDVAPLRRRLQDALGRAGFQVHVRWKDAGSKATVRVLDERSTRNHVAVTINRERPLAQMVLAGHAHAVEILLLECARQVCNWARARGLEIDLLEMQQVLLAQRLDEG